MKTFIYAVLSYIFWQVVALNSNLHSDGFWVQYFWLDSLMFVGFLFMWGVANVVVTRSDYGESEENNENNDSQD